MELVHEVVKLPPGSRVGVVCASARGSDNIAETLRLAGATGVDIVQATPESIDDLALLERTADLVLMSREALSMGVEERLERPERVREWLYEFDPSGLELLRRAIEHVQAARADLAEPAAMGEPLPARA
jgi:hypothetical protein